MQDWAYGFQTSQAHTPLSVDNELMVSNLRYLTTKIILCGEIEFLVAEQLYNMGDAIDLIGDGGVMKKIVRRSKPDAIAPSESLPLVDVHYEGTLADTGEVFDTTHEDNSIFSFEIGTGSVIKAWDVALRTMKVGEVAVITCKPEYAYGSAGSPPDIPPEATLVFEVELVACRPRKGSSISSVSDERARLEKATEWDFHKTIGANIKQGAKEAKRNGSCF
ncbi:hypothetical protein K7X08_031190 [Anisodus acutangulus]|uniref:peptidylprolyl isomerase n=1 Tax=Anisodus acutangulus TaxID=402998 RepID=A0A9Q1MKX6_9SOLA|nr:hypothetical protein K7X08_031190 [Anisodus acutangulus]